VLKDGVLQQVDTPQRLYDHPGNIFVAGFIGSPAMNFFSGTLTGTTDEMHVDSGSVRVRLSRSEIEQLGQKNIGREIIFGVRPEDIHHPRYKPPGVTEQLIEATVDVTELMGAEKVHIFDRATEKNIATPD
jgi:multiple sugar transport system ATP-binding protein